VQHSKVGIFILIAILQLNVGCSTLKTNREKILATMGAGLATGMILGATAKPAGDSATAWMLLGGAAGAAAGAGAGLYLFDETTVTDSLRAENETLKSKLETLKLANDPKLVDQGGSLLNAPLPADAKGLVRPGGWKRYKLDRWVQDQENKGTWYRQTEMFEFEIPSLGGEN
jgi:hypothetical protein